MSKLGQHVKHALYLIFCKDQLAAKVGSIHSQAFSRQLIILLVDSRSRLDQHTKSKNYKMSLWIEENYDTDIHTVSY